MARTSITPTVITRAGVAPPTETAGDSVNGNAVANSGALYLLLRNANGASTARNLTVAFANTVDGQTVAPRSYAVAAGASLYVGPFPISTYGQTLNINADNAELKITALQIG